MATKIIVPAQIRLSYPLTLGVQTDVVRPYKYHWRKNGALVGGSSGPALAILGLGKDDIGAKFNVTVFGEVSQETSDDVVIALPSEYKPIVAPNVSQDATMAPYAAGAKSPSNLPPYAQGAAKAPESTTIPPYAKRS
jgi:hypothetical protein